MNNNINLITLAEAQAIVRERMFGCCPDCFGNVPCDNGRVCDNCDTDAFCKAVKNEYERLISKA